MEVFFCGGVGRQVDRVKRSSCHLYPHSSTGASYDLEEDPFDY